MHPLGALAAGAFLAVPSAASSSSWHDGIEHDAVAAVSEATIHDAPLFRRVGTFAFERVGEADLRAVCGEVALPGTRREYVRFVALYRREGDGWARASEPAVEEWAADEPLRPPRLRSAMRDIFCRDAPPPGPPVGEAHDR
jgi:hypothetical protein